MTPGQRSEPVFFVRVAAPPPVTSTTPASVAAAEAALAAATANVADFAATITAAENEGASDFTTKDARVKAFLAAQSVATSARAAYESARAEAKKHASLPHAEPSAPLPDITASVLSLEYEEDEKKADQLTLTLRNNDLAYFDSPLFEKGTTLHVAWGYVGALSPVRELVVQKITGARTLKLVAQSKSVLMNTQTRVRTFEHRTRAEVARQIAEENGYGAELQDIEETSVRHAALAQAAQTDAQFLKRLADQEGFEFFVDFDGLHWHRRRLAQRPVRVLTYFLPPDVGEIKDFNVENDVTAKPSAVQVQGRDPLTKKAINVTADNESTARDALAPVIELIDRRTGESRETRQTSETSPAAAKTEADAIFRRTQLTAVKLTLDLVGDPYLVAKTVVEVRGLGQRLSGKYYLRAVKHVLDANGYKMEVKAQTDGTQTGAAKSKGTQNDKNAPSDAEALTPIDLVDERTGEQRTEYKDTRGRSAAR